MKNEPNKIRVSYFLVLVFSILYFLFLKKYYFISYEIPDYFLYYDFGIRNLPARDGFSSLFILIASKLIDSFVLIHCLMLLMMTMSLAIFCFGFFRISKSLLARFIFIFFIFSMGCWWYFYGKIFYEFPFIAFVYSIIFYCSSRFLSGEVCLLKYLETELNCWKLCFISFLIGFCLSWKMHAIFPLAGLICLICIREQSNLYALKQKIISWTGAFFAGYVTGNYRLLLSPLETIQGIRGYKSGSNPVDFFFSDDSIVWDHVNLLSFNTATLHWIPLICLFFVIPFFANHTKKLLFLNLLLFFAFIFFIYKFLPGLTWQGFPFSLYFIPLVAIFLFDGKLQNRFALLFVMAISIVQFFNNFFVYLPQQIQWADATNEAIIGLERNGSVISNDIQDLINKNGLDYSINLTLKRQLPSYPPMNIIELLQKNGAINITPSDCTGDCSIRYVINIEPTAMYKIRSYKPMPANSSDMISYPEYIISISK